VNASTQWMPRAPATGRDPAGVPPPPPPPLADPAEAAGGVGMVLPLGEPREAEEGAPALPADTGAGAPNGFPGVFPGVVRVLAEADFLPPPPLLPVLLLAPNGLPGVVLAELRDTDGAALPAELPPALANGLPAAGAAAGAWTGVPAEAPEKGFPGAAVPWEEAGTGPKGFPACALAFT